MWCVCMEYVQVKHVYHAYGILVYLTCLVLRAGLSVVVEFVVLYVCTSHDKLDIQINMH